MSISFLFLKIWGLRKIEWGKAILMFCKEQETNWIFLQETHSVKSGEYSWKSHWGDFACFAQWDIIFSRSKVFNTVENKFTVCLQL